MAVATVRYDRNQTKLYLSIGHVNNHTISTDTIRSYKFEYLDEKLDEIKKYYKNQKIVVITASHFPYRILLRLGLWRMSKLIRIEEGMGSYGNLISKAKGLWVSGYGRLVFRNAIGTVIAEILERIRLQEAIFLFDNNNNCNVVLTTKLRQVIDNLAVEEKLDDCYDTLILSTDFINKHLEPKANFFFNGHPSWGGENTDEKFQNYCAELLLQRSSIKTILTQFSSSSLYATFLSGALSVCISDEETIKQLTKRQISLFQKFGCILKW